MREAAGVSRSRGLEREAEDALEVSAHRRSIGTIRDQRAALREQETKSVFRLQSAVQELFEGSQLFNQAVELRRVTEHHQAGATFVVLLQELQGIIVRDEFE